ncbi:MAG: hypothetical protein RTS72_05595 [Candidatus Thorarchaeota archaeon]
MTNKGQLVVVMILTILLVGTLPNFVVNEATANPIAIYLEDAYGYLVLDSNMSMPEAFVNFTIEPSQTEGKWVSYDIKMNAVYTFLSPSDQEATIGLACPHTWFSNSSIVQIFENQTSLPLEIIPYDELVSPNETITSDWDYLDFITFNCTLEAGLPSDITVLIDLGTRAAENGFTFNYFVATAQSWNGTTHEVIIMNMKNPTVFQSCSFGPNISLTVTENPPWKIATWDLNMSDFEYERVSFGTSHKDLGFVLPTDPVIGGIIVTTTIAVLIMAVYVLRNRKY